MTHRIVGLAEVARLCGVSLSTVNRKTAQLRDFGAEKDDDGVWHVPVTAIEGVGWTIKPDTSRHVTDDMPVTRPDMPDETSSLRAENAELRAKLARAEADADKWQMVAAERLAHLDDMRRGQRLLEARNAEPVSTPAPVEVEPPAPVRSEEPATWRGRFRRVRGHG